MKIESKFELGEKVWFMFNNHVIGDTITKITSNTWKTHGNQKVYNSIDYFFASHTILNEKFIFKTKQELLDSL